MTYLRSALQSLIILLCRGNGTCTTQKAHGYLLSCDDAIAYYSREPDEYGSYRQDERKGLNCGVSVRQ